MRGKTTKKSKTTKEKHTHIKTSKPKMEKKS